MSAIPKEVAGYPFREVFAVMLWSYGEGIKRGLKGEPEPTPAENFKSWTALDKDGQETFMKMGDILFSFAEGEIERKRAVGGGK